MTPRQQYRVIGHYASFKTATANGPMLVGFHKGATVPMDATPESIQHHLSVGLIAPVGEPASSPEPAEVLAPGWDNPEADTPPAVKSGPETADPDLETRRAEARAKLPADGSPPKKTHGQQVWAEYAVVRGYDRALAEAATKDELIEMLSGAGAA